MVSKSIASLDAWLVQAEELLEELREQSLSPSSVFWHNVELQETISVGTFVASLEQLLDDLCRRPGRWILTVEEQVHGRFWRAYAFEDGSLVTQVVSNRSLEGQDRWSRAEMRLLRSLGWEISRHNWFRVEYTTSPTVAEIAQQTAETLRQVFGLVPHDEIAVTMFSSPARGGTPASPACG